MDEASTFNLSEIFVSIQGEGHRLGHPAIFVRTAGCNLHCCWEDGPCDTSYATGAATGTTVTVAQVVAQVVALRARYPAIQEIVITGGEPFLQPAVGDLVEALRGKTLLVMAETNGTIARDWAWNFVSISPKLRSSTPRTGPEATTHAERRLNLDVLRRLTAGYPHQLKFVVDQAADEAEIAAIVAELPEVLPTEVYLMPQGVTPAQLLPRARLCVEICLRRGWNYTPRAHLELFGNVRGR